ncbi:DUF4238 domain-containing protein [Erysipelatoclostridium ramosum]|jgi:hypothetical protein|uniref:DUF4238 domain-containing protein n=1 Tax=Thomasclavelia ramosa TaxID=1547 RepID=UPI000EA3C562|nr:DUF4238 domain-containing protein [Thomasclavelia ramosa]MCB6452244.1 DUF4238 domain-containing protein [Thomasclavelia ramosa]MCB7265902.1 DUF4238 domain-containing protein [Thomasclavelia ramosa]MCB7428026.1 DUF4238 domain-containing protein [Thomasclavelia ramosa]RKJ47763.1 DUF4238 domain-containing protein [bacterium 1XD42-54]
MADTKKEHYVPRCYLKNFVLDNDRINVFDKFKTQIRPQKIMDIAMENYFYDIKFDELIQMAEKDKEEKIKNDLMEIVGVDNWESVLDELDEKHIEKEFFSQLEGIYSGLLQTLINKSYGGNDWVIQNCLACSEIEKSFMALFIAIQIIRTKSFRDNLRDMITKTYQTLAYKSQMNNEDALPKEAFECEVNPDFVKLQHSSMILDEEMAVGIAETLCNHIWVMYVNKTEYPFYTSDNPVATIPHKHDKYMSYGGFNSEGVEIVFPISPKLLLAMYEKTTYDKLFSDRQFYALTSKDMVDYFNCQQVYHSYRCVFSGKTNFELAEKMCKEQPELQEYQSHIEVG